MSDFSVRSDNVDVEQIMRQIRSRIREKRGVDYTEDEIRELANVKLEKFIDPKGVRSDLLQQYRQAREASLPPNYKFEDTTLFETHRGPLAFIRRLLRPVLKLFFNPNPLIDALHIQSKLNDAHAAIEPLHYEIVHNLVLELTRTSIEVKSLKMRLESMASRLDFDERRARALEGVVQYRPGAVAPLQPPTGQEQRRDSRRDQGSRDQGRRDQGQRDRGPREDRPREDRPREDRPREQGPRDRGPQPPREIVAQQPPRPEGQEGNALDNEGNERRGRRRRRRGRRRGSAAREGSTAGLAAAGAQGDTTAFAGEDTNAGEAGLQSEEDQVEDDSTPDVEDPFADFREATAESEIEHSASRGDAVTGAPESREAGFHDDAPGLTADRRAGDAGAAPQSSRQEPPAPQPGEAGRVAHEPQDPEGGPVPPKPHSVEAERGEGGPVPPKPVEVDRGEGGPVPPKPVEVERGEGG